MIEFDERTGVANCPNPKCNGFVSRLDHYCGFCGILLPLPQTIDGLDDQAWNDLYVCKNHEEMVNNGDYKYCPICGKKL